MILRRKHLHLDVILIAISSVIYIYPSLMFVWNAKWVSNSLIFLNLSLNFLNVVNYILTRILVILYYFIYIYAKSYMVSHYNAKSFYIIFNLFAISMAILMSSSNLITAFIAWEFLSVTSFLLIAFYTLRIKASKSAFKALILNKFEDVALLLAFLNIYCVFYTTNNTIINTISFYINQDSDKLTFIRYMFILCAMTKCAQHIFSC